MTNKRNTFLVLLISILLTLSAVACGPSVKPGSVSASKGSGVAASAGSSGTYTVQQGDTLAGIAARHGTTVPAMVDANRGTYPSLATNPGLIQVGWELMIPGRDPTPSPQATPRERTVTIVSGNSVKTINADILELDVTVVEQEIFRLVNEERIEASLHPLEWDPVLAEIARARSQDMVDRGYHSHYDPETGELLVEKLLGERGYPPGGENVHRGTFWDSTSAATTSMKSWMNSAGHRENILRSEAHTTGVGVAKDLDQCKVVATQIFLR